MKSKVQCAIALSRRLLTSRLLRSAQTTSGNITLCNYSIFLQDVSVFSMMKVLVMFGGYGFLALDGARLVVVEVRFFLFAMLPNVLPCAWSFNFVRFSDNAVIGFADSRDATIAIPNNWPFGYRAIGVLSFHGRLDFSMATVRLVYSGRYLSFSSANLLSWGYFIPIPLGLWVRIGNIARPLRNGWRGHLPELR